MLGPLCFIAACWSALACGAFADVEIRIKLQHNLGKGFVDAGLITGAVANEIQPKSKLRLDWSIPETTVAQLNELAAADRTYQLRIENNTGDKLAGDAMISLPARCFEASLQALHRLDMHTTMDGQLMGIQVAADPLWAYSGYLAAAPWPPRKWRFERTLDCSSGVRRVLKQWPDSSKVTVHIPILGPDISDLAPSLIDEKYSEKLRSAYDEIRSGGRQEEGSEDAKKAQKEQREKTFWEKNWMFVLAGAMLLFNVVATKPPPSGGAAPQGRPAR